MASPSPGWLSPAGADPTRRALQLLGTFLEEEQKEQVQRWGGFAHEDRDRIYWIPVNGRSPRCARLDMRVINNYCVAPREKRGVRERMPGPDVALTHLLWIRHDPKGFLKEANLTVSSPIPDDVCGERLFELLARGRSSGEEGPRVRGPAYEPFTPGPVITPAQRERGLAMARDLRVALQVDGLREFFDRNGVDVTDEMLRKLATTRG